MSNHKTTINIQIVNIFQQTLGIDKIPTTSTLSHAIINRKSDVFGTIYQRYSPYLSEDYIIMGVGKINCATKIYAIITIKTVIHLV